MNTTTQDETENKAGKKATRFRLPWPTVDRASAIAKLIFQLTATTGGLLLLLYCVEAGHYPTGATIADVLLLLAISVVVAAVYAAMAAVLYEAALIVAQPFRWLVNRQLKRKHKDQTGKGDSARNTAAERKVPGFDALEWFLCAASFLLIAVLVILRFWANPLALASLAYCIFIVGILRIAFAVTKLNPKHDRRSKRDFAMVIACAIFFAPIYTGVVAQLDILPLSLRAIGVRKENVAIFVSKQRAVLIDDELQGSKPAKVLGDYQKYDNASIIMRGIGAESVVEIGNRRWILPNDQFVISYSAKAESNSSSAQH
jgi:hypothetical protein